MIYTIVADQVIMGMSGPVALNHNAIHMAMDLYNISDKQQCFQKVLTLGRHFIGNK